VDNVLSAGNTFTKSGYTFTYAGTNVLPVAAPTCAAPGWGNFTINANPVSRGGTGQRSFFIDETGVICFNTAAAAAVTDPPIQ